MPWPPKKIDQPHGRLKIQCSFLRISPLRRDVEVIEQSFEDFQAPFSLLWFNVNDLKRCLVVDWMC
jgi:hypothetical protein